jgi:hypothetical protein
MTENSLPPSNSIYNLSKQEEKISKNKLLIIAGALCVVLLVIAVALSFFMPKQAKVEEQSSSTKQSQTQTTGGNKQDTPAKKMAHPLPQVTVGTWKISAPAVTVPRSLRTFSFLENYSLSDFKNILAGLIKEPKIDENAGRFSAKTSTDMLYLQKPSGAFVYISSDGVALPQQVKPQTVKSSVETFVHNMFHENTLVITNEYDKTSTPGIHYYELHRSWDSVSLPILSFFGLFNTQEAIPFSKLKIGVAVGNVKDKRVINTSDKTDGLRRPNDFSTVTVGVKEGKVISVASNARRIKAVEQIPTISYDEAVTRLKANRYDKIYTIPAGEGAVDYAKLYPKDTAKLSQVEVTESILTYLEEMPGTVQTKLIPYYVFRGSGVLASGYRVKVLAAVSATKQEVLGASTSRLLAQSEDENPGINLGTFTPTPTPPPPTPLPTQPPVATPPQVGPTAATLAPDVPANQSPCTGGIDVSNQTMQTDANGNQYFVNTEDLDLYVIPKTTDITQLTNILETGIDYSNVKAGDRPQLDINIRPDIGTLFDGGLPAGCPIRVTGPSPTLFIYSSTTRSISLSPNFSLTYADPFIKNDNWDVSVNSSNRLLVNGVSRPYIYYEYQPVTFNKPKLGWTVKKDEIGNFSKQIGKKLSLTELETQRVASEIGNSAKDVRYSTLFIGLIPQQELNSKLPISTTQQPQAFHRVHFYLTGATGTEPVSSPSLKPLERFPYMFLEIGAVSGLQH